MAASPALTAILGDVLWCLGLGCLLGACRDLTGLLLGEGPVRCFVWDVAAFMAAAVLLYGFCAGVSASGVARWYMTGAMLAGALAWNAAFRRPLHRAAGLCGRLLLWPFRTLRGRLLRPLLRRGRAALNRRRQKHLAKRTRKREEKRKKQLQKPSKILYN